MSVIRQKKKTVQFNLIVLIIIDVIGYNNKIPICESWYFAVGVLVIQVKLRMLYLNQRQISLYYS